MQSCGVLLGIFSKTLHSPKKTFDWPSVNKYYNFSHFRTSHWPYGDETLKRSNVKFVIGERYVKISSINFSDQNHDIGLL
jgi:hypothetical protein